MNLFASSLFFISISNFCLANNENHGQCISIGNHCKTTDQCCSSLICYPIQGTHYCSPATIETLMKRQSEDGFIPPYYNSHQQIHYNSLIQPNAASHKAQESNPGSKGKNLDWSPCHYHDDCGEGFCCYVHFRFRSLPKWFCRPIHNEQDEFCEPLSQYRFPKDQTLLKVNEAKSTISA